MIEVNNLMYNYPGGPKMQFPDLQVLPDEVCLVIGQSGVGKTTLLHLLAGLMKPKSGTILINNTDIGKLAGRKLDKFRGEQIGIIFQKNHFVKALTVIENLSLTQKLAGIPSDIRYCNELLSKLNIDRYSNKRPDSLSEGEKQRVSIARALVTKPKLVLADEPTSALDDTNCMAVYDLLKKHADDIDASLIIVTHDGRLKSLVDKHVELSKLDAHV